MSATLPPEQWARMTPLARQVMENEFTRKRGNLNGKTFGRLSVVGAAGLDQCLCLCRCGSYKVVLRQYLLDGEVQSCGCLKRELDRMKARFNQRRAVAGKLAQCKRKRRAKTEIVMRARKAAA